MTLEERERWRRKYVWEFLVKYWHWQISPPKPPRKTNLHTPYNFELRKKRAEWEREHGNN